MNMTFVGAEQYPKFLVETAGAFSLLAFLLSLMAALILLSAACISLTAAIAGRSPATITAIQESIARSPWKSTLAGAATGVALFLVAAALAQTHHPIPGLLALFLLLFLLFLLLTGLTAEAKEYGARICGLMGKDFSPFFHLCLGTVALLLLLLVPPPGWIVLFITLARGMGGYLYLLLTKKEQSGVDTYGN